MIHIVILSNISIEDLFTVILYFVYSLSLLLLPRSSTLFPPSIRIWSLDAELTSFVIYFSIILTLTYHINWWCYLKPLRPHWIHLLSCKLHISKITRRPVGSWTWSCEWLLCNVRSLRGSSKSSHSYTFVMR